ncbi:MAG: glutamine--fructose-6-phosphate transaminase (isomerizing) [Proteobacteria bacterium]|nr:glutamine--fructose-6-phosphate transaminase (isomerizing) [Pseudomonadota bacterium]
MCGIVGYVGAQPCAPILVDGLRRLEYRGYDSAGLALHDGTRIGVLRAVGKLNRLEEALRARPLVGTTGIGHTRWATHGQPSEANAHPHEAGEVVLIHNGIIENHLSLRAHVEERGSTVTSDTDTEIVAHLVDQHYANEGDLASAVRRALEQVEGAYAIAVLARREPGRLVVAKNESPLVIGLGERELFCGSDIPALLPYTRDVIVLEDGEMAVLGAQSCELSTLDGKPVTREPTRIDWSPLLAEKAGYKHFMLKEIFEQPRAIEDTLRGRLDREHADVHSSEIGLGDDLARSIERVYLLACGTSYHAAMADRYYLEQIARVPTTVELASEFRNREPVLSRADLAVAISQSGETLDTLMAGKLVREHGTHLLAIANVVGSAIARASDAAFYTHAGPEIGVASTKCFTTQLAALLMLSIYLGRQRGTLDEGRARQYVEGLARLPHHMRDVIQGTRQLVANVAKRYSQARDVLFIGRGLNFPIALEGALKLKEISYVHAEGYAAGEMKHGPIALIDASVPVIVLAPQGCAYDKSVNNLQEAKARDARIIAVGTEGDEQIHRLSDEIIEIPKVGDPFVPFLTVLPLQLFAYYVADFKGTDVDQPRNLAKTVTVE